MSPLGKFRLALANHAVPGSRFEGAIRSPSDVVPASKIEVGLRPAVRWRACAFRVQRLDMIEDVQAGI